MSEELPPASLSNKLPSLALESAPLPMATVEGATHRLRYGNPAFCRLIGKTMEQLSGVPISELLPEKDKCVSLIDRVFRTGRPMSHTEKDASSPGPVFWSYTMWPLLADELLVGVMIQVTESTKAHETMVEMNEALLIGSLRQHKLTEAAEALNERLQAEIAERQRTARDLAEKARLLDLTHDAVIVRDIEGRITYWNCGAEEVYGWSPEEAIGKLCHSLFQTEFSETLEDEITRELHRTGRWTGELVQARRDGRRITVLVRKSLDRDSEGNPASVLLNITDITERKRAEVALREAGERFRFMAESMPQKVFTARPDGEVEYLNRQWEEFTGLPLGPVRGLVWKRFIHPDDVEESARRWRKSLATGAAFQLEHRFRRRDGEYRWHLSRAFAMRDAAGAIMLWIGSSTDIDDMMRAQEELMDAEAKLADHASQLERLVARRTKELTVAHARLLAETEERKRLEAAVADAIEEERERLGRELHDGLLQELTGIAMMLHALARRLEEPAPLQAKEAERLCGMLERAHQNARDLSKDFYPVELKQHGLLVALKGVAQRTEDRFGISCVVRADSDAMPELSEATAVQVFRIAQEAVGNAVKHALARNIRIRLRRAPGIWKLTVTDDGVGLPEGAGESGGMGLRIMRYRAQILRGSLMVGKAEDGGTEVSCIIPAGDPGTSPELP
jgi:PAS domain S-box-containing protein